MPAYKADRRLFLTADRKVVVEEGDPRSAFLLAVPGQEVPGETAERLGLHRMGKPKADAPAEDKASKPSATKSATKERGA